MALVLKKSNSKDATLEGAIKLTKEQALRYQIAVIDKWDKTSDV